MNSSRFKELNIQTTPNNGRKSLSPHSATPKNSTSNQTSKQSIQPFGVKPRSNITLKIGWDKINEGDSYTSETFRTQIHQRFLKQIPQA